MMEVGVSYGIFSRDNGRTCFEVNAVSFREPLNISESPHRKCEGKQRFVQLKENQNLIELIDTSFDLIFDCTSCEKNLEKYEQEAKISSNALVMIGGHWYLVSEAQFRDFTVLTESHQAFRIMEKKGDFAFRHDDKLIELCQESTFAGFPDQTLTTLVDWQHIAKIQPYIPIYNVLEDDPPVAGPNYQGFGASSIITAVSSVFGFSMGISFNRKQTRSLLAKKVYSLVYELVLSEDRYNHWSVTFFEIKPDKSGYIEVKNTESLKNYGPWEMAIYLLRHEWAITANLMHPSDPLAIPWFSLPKASNQMLNKLYADVLRELEEHKFNTTDLKRQTYLPEGASRTFLTSMRSFYRSFQTTPPPPLELRKCFSKHNFKSYSQKGFSKLKSRDHVVSGLYVVFLPADTLPNQLATFLLENVMDKFVFLLETGYREKGMIAFHKTTDSVFVNQTDKKSWSSEFQSSVFYAVKHQIDNTVSFFQEMPQDVATQIDLKVTDWETKRFKLPNILICIVRPPNTDRLFSAFKNKRWCFVDLNMDEMVDGV